MKIKRNVLLNPGPATTTDTVKLAQVVPDICPREAEFAEVMREMRGDLVRVVHGGDDYASVPFCGSGTICIDVCLNSLLPAGGKALIVNNGAYSSRAVEVCEHYGLPHVDLRLPADRPVDPGRVRAALESDRGIALVYATHHETGSGVGNPIRELGALARGFGAVFCVDTTSSYAMVPIDVVRDNIDFCMASAQKGLMAMAGLSFVIGRRDLIEASRAYPKRSYYCNLHLQYRFFEETGEMHFTPPVQTVYALRQGLREYFEEGEEAKWARHTRVYRRLCEGLGRLGFRQAVAPGDRIGLVCSVLYPDDGRWDFGRVHDYCYARGFTIYPGKMGSRGTFRLCALGAIDAPDADAFFRVFEEALRASGVGLPVRYAGAGR